jgi:hypothetical protein
MAQLIGNKYLGEHGSRQTRQVACKKKVVSRHQGNIEYDYSEGGHISQRQEFLQTDESYILVRTCNTTTIKALGSTNLA